MFFSKPDDYLRLKEILKMVININDGQNILKAINQFTNINARHFLLLLKTKSTFTLKPELNIN